MKYGESAFVIIYLLFTFICAVRLLVAHRTKITARMGLAALILALGDACHLVPRVLRYFLDSDFTVPLGVGKLITSLTMTVFYVLMIDIHSRVYRRGQGRRAVTAALILAAVRAALCLFPQNGWLTNTGSVTWGVIRNVPFVLLGALAVTLYYRDRDREKTLRPTWLLVTLSFLFYLPVVVFASVFPPLGMLMIPKTVCYMALVALFLQYEKTA